ncbi:glycosyltransferase family 1 protein [Vibrio metschnikovii]|uniref:Glycosyltransferase family 1 protein n=1 Tax=Vibrio metschnikovii TaxID=28172 RepID=A0A9X0R943_VIBME|nr:glycosyltransferase family 1 protein [Vibrio metschnikovii]MBC5851953.1 glycosyltransferase family 1 protein [Vibrio metschnikovii]
MQSTMIPTAANAPSPRWLVIQERENPSFDFFVKPKLEAMQLDWCSCLLAESPSQCSLLQLAPSTSDEPTYHLLFVRYINAEWRRWIFAHRQYIASIVFFIDDDLFDWQATAGLPARYRWKLWNYTLKHHTFLRKMNAELWVANEYLQQKYASWQPVICPPKTWSAPSISHTIFYHGSASHKAEFSWLKPLFERLLKDFPQLSIELIGDGETNALFRHLPRVHVLHPMSWANYRALLTRGRRDIGLAPLLESSFNAARSCTKFYDICQAGAVGIYADHSAYRNQITDQVNGLLLAMDHDAWYAAIAKLLQDDAYYQRLLAGCVVND